MQNQIELIQADGAKRLVHMPSQAQPFSAGLSMHRGMNRGPQGQNAVPQPRVGRGRRGQATRI